MKSTNLVSFLELLSGLLLLNATTTPTRKQSIRVPEPNENEKVLRLKDI